MNKCEEYIESMDNPTRAGRVQEALVHLLYEINSKLENKKETKPIVEKTEQKVEAKATPKKTTRKKKVIANE